jgi:3-oxoacyl-[acyl-carrier protein] reductase
MLLDGKTAIITGSNRGIGYKILETFSENGANVFACSRKIDDEFISKINNLSRNCNNEIYPIELDLSDENNVKAASEKILEKKKINILVNNAATIYTSLFQMTSVKKLNEVFKINFLSQTMFTQYILKSMIREKSGSIIYISSSSATDGNAGRFAYASSKAALNAQAKVLSREVGKNNIRVNVIAPGLTNTDMMVQNTSKEMIEKTLSGVSLNRVAEPKEISNTALFLASELSSYLTGQIIRVDGGM